MSRARWIGLIQLVAMLVAAVVVAQDADDGESAGDAPAEIKAIYFDDETPLLDRDPFDLIVLDEENRNFKAEIQTVKSLPRPVLPESAKKEKLQFRFLYDDAFLYEVEWIHVVRFEYFENMLFAEAQRLLKEAKGVNPKQDFAKAERLLDEAYRYLSRLTNEYPKYPRLEAAMDAFLFQDAGTLYANDRYAESLSVMEELYARNPGYAGGRLKTVMDTLIDKIIPSYIKISDFRSARIVLDRLAEKYGDDQPQKIEYWRKQLDALATKKLAAAREKMEAKEFRESIEFVRQALDISPKVPGGTALQLELAETFPQIIVGVTQPALNYDSGRMDNWSARRTGRLVHRPLVEFLGAGSEGGEYQFPGGLIERSPDGRTMTFRMKQFTEGEQLPISGGYDLSRRLLELAGPSSSEYREGWGSLVTGISVQDVLRVDVSLRRSHVLPQALLRVPMVGSRLSSDGEQVIEGTGSFNVDVLSDDETRFLLKGFTPGSRLAELIERRFEDANSALNALRRGQIDVIDRLFPSDAARLQDKLRNDANLVVQKYSLPTVQCLVPKSDHPFLANRNFRRALVFGIDRHRILHEELLGGAEIPGCRILSGPFPAGLDQTDPLGYAYDHELEPRAWRPRLAKLLTIIAEKELTTMAEIREEEPPALTPLVLAHPATEAARITCRAIASHLSVIGIVIETKELPPGESTASADDCDLLYTEFAVWEPVADARRLFGVGGVAETTSPFIGQILRRLDAAENWGDVRDQLVALHRSAHDEVAVVPLWQTVDFFVYNKRLRNIGDSPVWLYQYVDQWRLGAQTARAE